MNITHYKITLLALVAAAGLLCSSCTHNDGDIGIWFGTWHVETDDAVIGDCFIQFQNSVACVRTVDDRHDAIECFGTWSEPEPGVLCLDFPDDDQWRMILPGVTQHGTRFNVSITDSRHIILTTSAGERIITLRLTKWG